MPALARDVEFSCGRGRFVSVVRAVCHTQLGNQLSAYAALLYFTARHGYHAVLDPFQIKIIGAVFRRVETRAVTLIAGDGIRQKLEFHHTHLELGALGYIGTFLFY